MAALQSLNVGTVPNDGTGDTWRGAHVKIKANFAELAARQVHVNDYASLAAAVSAMVSAGDGGTIWIGEGVITLSAKLVVPDDSMIRIRGIGRGSILRKAFNGDMISLGKQCALENLALEGVGGTYTGRGVIIETGTAFIVAQERQIINCWILDTASYGVEFTQADAGYASTISDCFIVPTSTSTPAIKWPAAASVANVMLTNLYTGSSRIADFAGAINVQVNGCQGAFPTYSTITTKVAAAGSRFVTSSTSASTFQGIANTVAGCTINEVAITFASGMGQCSWKGNAVASGTTVTDTSDGIANGNDIDITSVFPSTSYVPTWTGSSVNPAIGDGTLTGFWTREGERIKLNIRLTFGSTTTPGTGYWEFTAPRDAYRYGTGTATILDASGIAVYAAVCEISASDDKVRVLVSGTTSTYVGAAVPMAWTTSDQLVLDIEYII